MKQEEILKKMCVLGNVNSMIAKPLRMVRSGEENYFFSYTTNISYKGKKKEKLTLTNTVLK